MYKIQEVTDTQIMTGSKALSLMPPMAKLPQEFQRGTSPWCEVFSRWFFTGLPVSILTPKPGVDKAKALRHLKAIIGSFEPKHEHKEAGVAYLLSEWFEPIKQ